MTLDAKLDGLHARVAALPSALVAFSGGVDSSLLLRVVHEALGDRCVALTTVSPTTPVHDLERARTLATELGVTHLLVDSDELEIPGYAENPTNRCYLCKGTLYEICRAEASRRRLETVIDGVNADDLGDYRPGLRAAREHGVRHPLAEAGLTKADVRAASHALGLATWDQPASPCLASRVPYGTRITAESLRRIDAAERWLRDEGFGELRVRAHEELARIEVPVAELPRLLDVAVRRRVVGELKRLGFTWITLDLQGFRSGSLNEALER